MACFHQWFLQHYFGLSANTTISFLSWLYQSFDFWMISSISLNDWQSAANSLKSCSNSSRHHSYFPFSSIHLQRNVYEIEKVFSYKLTYSQESISWLQIFFVTSFFSLHNNRFALRSIINKTNGFYHAFFHKFIKLSCKFSMNWSYSKNFPIRTTSFESELHLRQMKNDGWNEREFFYYKL